MTTQLEEDVKVSPAIGIISSVGFIVVARENLDMILKSMPPEVVINNIREEPGLMAVTQPDDSGVPTTRFTKI